MGGTLSYRGLEGKYRVSLNVDCDAVYVLPRWIADYNV